MKEIKLYFDIIYYFTNNDERDIFNEFDALYIIGDIDWDIIVIVNHNIKNY
jgi:hypothetical protein